MVGDEREGQLGWRAKWAATFFNRSRSTLSRWTSARSRRSSSSAGVDCCHWNPPRRGNIGSTSIQIRPP